MWGPPGTAKTFLTDDIAALPGAERYAGYSTTKSGLTGLLLAKRPRYLIPDELDKMPRADMTPLLNLVEGAYVSVLQHEKAIRVQLACWVIATANRLAPSPAPIQSRFNKVEIPSYTRAEFQAVAVALLVARQGLGLEEARLIANEVARKCLDVRVAINIGRVAKGHPDRAISLVAGLFPEKGKRTVLREPGKDR